MISQKNKFENPDTYFPEVSKELEVIGFTEDKIPVAIAIGDNQASFLGSVKNNGNSFLINIGTGSQICACVKSHINCTSLEMRPFIKDTVLMVGAPLCGGRAYSLLERFFRSIVTKSTGQECVSLYEVMGKIACESMEIKNKLNLSTQFSGTRENPNLRGAIENIDINNFTMEHFIIGIMEGMASELFDLYKELIPNLKETPKILIASGNGLRRNTPLQNIVSKKFDLPINIPYCEEEAAYGVALFALTSIGYFKDISEAQSKIK